MARRARVPAAPMPHHTPSRELRRAGVPQRGDRPTRTFVRALGHDNGLPTTMQRHERVGRALGDRAFLRCSEALHSRRITPARPGRARKKLSPDFGFGERWECTVQEIVANVLANRPGRVEPRVLKRRRHRYPLMRRPRPDLRKELAKS